MTLLRTFSNAARWLRTVPGLRGYRERADAISALESSLESLSDDELRARTSWLKQRFSDGETLDDLLPDAYATVREAAKRTLGQRPYDVQLIGGMVLHEGKIAEMKTGEGKTLAATMPAYLNALGGQSVHVVTVNDYLAQRDAEWVGKVHRFLGLTVAALYHGQTTSFRKEVYKADVIYGAHSEFVFDYLRDNMQITTDEVVQTGQHYAILDEVDSILIDDARMPLAILRPTTESPSTYNEIDRLVRNLEADHVELNERERLVSLTDEGIDRVEELLRESGHIKNGSLFDYDNIQYVHFVTQSLLAQHIYKKDKDYVIKGDEVVAIDEVRGRMSTGRRLADGLHEALEAKEGLPLRPQGIIVSQTSYQNYFRLYRKLAGMTGTARSEMSEYSLIYGLDVVEIPPNRPFVRVDHDDEVYRSEAEKLDALVERVADCHRRSQPVMVGTPTVEKSEVVSKLLAERGIPHEILNARHHEREAFIIGQAGKPGAVTVATNMAGRGTDIQLGGNAEMRIALEIDANADAAERARKAEAIRAEVDAAKEVVRAAGGLCILGTERFFCRRVDDQLIGRAGRQGDPGETTFMMSLDDELIRVFGGGKALRKRVERLGVSDGQAMFHRWLTQAIKRAQKSVDDMFFESRRDTLEYDDVAHEQRKLVFNLRRELMTADDLLDRAKAMRDEVLDDVVNRRIPPEAYAEQWDMDGLDVDIRDIFNLALPLRAWASEEGVAGEEILSRLSVRADFVWRQNLAHLDPATAEATIRRVALNVLDETWQAHQSALDHLRHGISLRSYGQRVPIQEYKTEAYNFFSTMLLRYRNNVVRAVSRIQGAGSSHQVSMETTTSVAPIVKRLQPCPCGSGRRYKDCHGKTAA